ncbi:MAG: hypothetical protein LBV13_02175 [Methanomassiliicoccaceae archaeon]|jgi:hypothetical protein|nr:hypothetical protein [Methanomassiliicoccaceae archaeon]
MDDTEDTWYDIVEDEKDDENEMSTEIRFEIFAGDYDTGTKEKTVRSRAMGIVKGATSEAARMALSIRLELLLAKLLKEKGKE